MRLLQLLKVTEKLRPQPATQWEKGTRGTFNRAQLVAVIGKIRLFQVYNPVSRNSTLNQFHTHPFSYYLLLVFARRCSWHWRFQEAYPRGETDD